MRVAALFALVCAVASPVSADPPMWSNEVNAESCESSYAERLADARQAVVQWQAYEAERAKALPAVEWFGQHCRWLSEREVAIRALDDADAFVCDTKRGRPKGLTAELVYAYQFRTPLVGFVRWTASDDACAALDAAAGRAPIALHDETIRPDDRPGRVDFIGRVTEVMCWHVESAKCDEMRASVARARAAITPSPEAPRQESPRTEPTGAPPDRR